MQQKIEKFTQQVKEAVATEQLLLPSLPDVALRVRDECEKENSSAQNIADIIGQDPALSVRLLQVANSSLYRTRAPADNLSIAITRLGLKLVKDLIMGLALKQLYRTSNNIVQEQFRELWFASTKVAAISRLLATHCDHLSPEQAMLAGLTHNVGALPILLLAEEDDDLFENPEELCKITKKMQGEVGAYIFKSWHFPDFMSDVAKNSYSFDRFHERPADYTDIVQVALIESSIYTGLACPDNWSTVPAFQQLNINPEISVLEVDENRIIFEETSTLFA